MTLTCRKSAGGGGKDKKNARICAHFPKPHLFQLGENALPKGTDHASGEASVPQAGAQVRKEETIQCCKQNELPGTQVFRR